MTENTITKCLCCLFEAPAEDVSFHTAFNHTPEQIHRATVQAEFTDSELPVDDDGTEIFTVEYRGDDEINGKCLYRVEFISERDAVRRITACGIYTNLTLVGFGANIDYTAYIF